MDDFIWINDINTYINKSLIVSITFKGYMAGKGQHWRAIMSNGDFFDISLDELNSIIGTGE